MAGLPLLVPVSAVLTGIAAAALTRLLVRPTPRLGRRVRPYTLGARTGLGGGTRTGVPTAGVVAPDPPPGTRARRLERVAAWLGVCLDGCSEEDLLGRLEVAGLLTGIPPERRVAALRVRELTATVLGGALALPVGLSLPVGPPAVALLTGLGLVVGATRWRARIERAVEERRARMRIELYTVNQLLALDVRAGGGVVQATRRITERGRGVVVAQLHEVLRLHRSGLPAREAFARVAATSPEPAVARTLRLLGAGAEHGADLADALLEHSDDVREARRQAVLRTATRRRAAMLVPVVGVLAPVMLLFVGAPLTSLILGAS